MCCCNPKPSVVLSRRASLFVPTVVWHDGNRCGGTKTRTIQWRFYRNGLLVHATGFGLLTASLPIGTGSTYAGILGGDAAIMAYLVDDIGLTFAPTDVVAIEVKVKNCQGETAVSNRLLIDPNAYVEPSDCDCTLLSDADTGNTGTNIPAPAFPTTNGYMAFVNGVFNGQSLLFPEGLVAEDITAVVALTGCDALLDYQSSTGHTGNVPLPFGYEDFPAGSYLVFRNGLLERGYSISGTNLVPASPSLADDTWEFVAITGTESGDTGCRFGTLTVSESFTGTTLNLPSGYTAANQGEWMLEINGLFLFPTLDYTVSGGVVTTTRPYAGDRAGLVRII